MQFQKIAVKLPFFSTQDLVVYDPNFNRFQITEWRAKGYIQRIKRGFYIVSGFSLSERELFLIANKIYEPSYISLESALRHYNLIPEGVFTTTSLSTKKTTRISTPVGNFQYRSMTPALFFGYTLVASRLGNARMAEPEKAVLDYLYFHPRLADAAALDELRFNHSEFKRIYSRRRLRDYVKRMPNTMVRRRAESVLQKYL